MKRKEDDYHSSGPKTPRGVVFEREKILLKSLEELLNLEDRELFVRRLEEQLGIRSDHPRFALEGFTTGSGIFADFFRETPDSCVLAAPEIPSSRKCSSTIEAISSQPQSEPRSISVKLPCISLILRQVSGDSEAKF